MKTRTAVVTGATGLVGAKLAEHLATQPGWRVVCISRGEPNGRREGPIQFMQADLLDKGDCLRIASQIDGATHLFNAARFDHTTLKLESPDLNTEMVGNLLDAFLMTKQPLEHVHLVHGTKYYGSHLGPFQTPAREDDPRSLQSNFYYRQEDLVIARHAAEGWSWSTSRPHVVLDVNAIVPRSVFVLIAVYAAISKHLGLPLCFPGTPENYKAVYQLTDAGLLARAIEWMSTCEGARNQAFNVTNGDYIRWCNLWPAFARYFGMEVGPVRTVRLAQVMADKGDVWREIAQKHGLVQSDFSKVALWTYADFVFTPGWDIMSSTTKARTLGFQDHEDSQATFFRAFDFFREQRFIPKE